jgi:DNA-binding Lrp family transcriptional regulator
MTNLPIDEIDLAIIEVLRIDGRASSKRIAEQLGLNEGKVRRTISRLQKEQIVRISALPTFPGNADIVVTLVLVKTKSNVMDTANKIADWPQVPWLCVCGGDADLMLTIYASDLSATANVLHEINALGGVEELRSHICLQTEKAGYTLHRSSSGFVAYPSALPGDDGDPSFEPADAMDIAPVLQWLEDRVDGLDIRIIEALNHDGRAAYTDIGRSLGLAEASVRKRVKRLIGQDIIRITAVPIVRLHDETFAGLVRVNIATDPRPIAEAIARWPEVGWLALTAGDCSIAFDVISASRSGYLDLIERTHNLAGVVSVNSLVTLRTIKQVYLGPAAAPNRKTDAAQIAER